MTQPASSKRSVPGRTVNSLAQQIRMAVVPRAYSSIMCTYSQRRLISTLRCEWKNVSSSFRPAAPPGARVQPPADRSRSPGGRPLHRRGRTPRRDQPRWSTGSRRPRPRQTGPRRPVITLDPQDGCGANAAYCTLPRFRLEVWSQRAIMSSGPPPCKIAAISSRGAQSPAATALALSSWR